jgi:hypothetical protein
MLVTRAFIIYNLTLIFEIPKTRQLVYTALNTRFAAANLANIIESGLVEAFEIFIPKYLKSLTVLIYSLPTYIYYCSL